MGLINFFAQQQFGAALRPGEVLEVMGIGVYKQLKSYAIFGLTNQRLLFLEVPADTWVVAPKAEVTARMSFELSEITSVIVEPDSDLLGSLTRFAVCRGPATAFALGAPEVQIRGVLRAAPNPFGNKWNFTGFDGHQEWNDFVPAWLARHVPMGTLRSPQGVAQALGELRAAKANRTAMLAHSAQLAAQANAAREAAASIKWPYVVCAAFALFAFFVGFGNAYDGVKFHGRTNDFEERVEQSAVTRKGTWADPKVAARAREQIEVDRSRATGKLVLGIVTLLVGLGGAAGFAAVGVKLNKKKRAALAQAQAQGQAQGGAVPALQPARTG